MSENSGESVQDRSPIRVLLLEDDVNLRERFAGIILGWPGAELVAACSCLAEARRVLQSQSVDLLMTDLRLPDGHGVEAIRLLRQVNPAADSVVISVLADEETVIDAIEAGAVGYLLKDVGSIELIDIIQELRAGRSPISSSIARILIRRMSAHSAQRSDDESLLTPRETEILWGIAKGYTYAELAERLGISRNTVPGYIKNIYRKLAANNRSEAVFEATRRGLIRIGSF
ncbi:MAG TPA: response regulator transcription factor [Steroidobacter sp.]